MQFLEHDTSLPVEEEMVYLVLQHQLDYAQ